MPAYLALLISELRISARERSVVFFNYLFPLVFFFMFGELMNARSSLGSARFIVSTVLSIGIMGNGFFGMGMRTVQARELGILRRLRLAPITPAPLLFSSVISGVLVYLLGALITIALANWVYNVPAPSNVVSLFAFIVIGNAAFRGIGLIIASVADSMAEAQILIQILYIPMMFLSGTTFPMSNLPKWVQIFSRFLPATYLKAGLEGILQNGESLAQNAASVAALLGTLVVGIIVSFHLFRWSKDDRIHASSKAWVAAVLAPFLVLGAWETYGGNSAVREAIALRQLARSTSFRIHDARVFAGDGPVVDRADVFIRNGRIVDVVEEGRTSSENLSSYTTIEGAGKTVVPGLIDVHAHLGAAGIVMSEGFDQEMANWPEHAVRSYLYSGVTAAKSVGDATGDLLKLKHRLASGEILGAELFMTGPLFTAPGGHGTEYFRSLPEMLRKSLEPQMAAAYSAPSDAAARVDSLAAQGVDGIKAVLESGGSESLFERLDLSVFDAVVQAAERHKLPVVVHTGTPQDVQDAINRDVAGIEHGSMRDVIPDDVIRQMASKGVRYDPTLVVLDSIIRIAHRDAGVVEDPLVRQTIPAKLVARMRTWVRNHDVKTESAQIPELKNTAAVKNLINAYRSGVPLVVGTDSGNPAAFHGPALHREMELWQDVGIAPADILKAATSNAAQLLGAGDRIGKVAKGYEASLLIVDGNPLDDIRGTRRISDVFLKGERVRRSALFASGDN
jgi:imidazolonepropionase-like amidohydrolase/ABC-type multidrug transport system permease subunit